MAGLWGVLFAGVLALSGAVPVRAQFASNGSSSSLQTAAGATASARAATTADMPTGAGAADLVNESDPGGGVLDGAAAIRRHATGTGSGHREH